MPPESALPSLFNLILRNYDEIVKPQDGAKDISRQSLVRKSCDVCQEAIRMVNQLDLFSKNESLDDLSTQSIRYLTLPAFLGFFNCQKADREERLDTLRLSKVYYDEFMDLITAYGIPDLPKRQPKGDSAGALSSDVYSTSSGQPGRSDPFAIRDEKIRAYKEKKALLQRFKNFISLDFTTVDDEILRVESVAFVRFWAYAAVEELKFINEEIAILTHSPGREKPSSQPNPQPPLLITREKVRAAVFGAGYPSVPTMTLDQFLEMQVKQGIMPAPQAMKNDKINSGEGSWRRVDPSESERSKHEADERAARHDALEDSFSEEQRSKAREFDEFKDEHRRGSGNRANRG